VRNKGGYSSFQVFLSQLPNPHPSVNFNNCIFNGSPLFLKKSAIYYTVLGRNPLMVSLQADDDVYISFEKLFSLNLDQQAS